MPTSSNEPPPANTGASPSSASPTDGTVLEGFIDLLYREDDGTLMIVDYKTDAIPAAALEARIAHYSPQLNAYTTMLPTKAKAALLFLSPTQAHAHHL